MIDRILNKIGLRKFASANTLKNISTLMTGTFIASVIPILSAPIMARLFTTKDYGVLGIYFSITTIVGVLAYSHYSQAIMIEKEVENAKNVLWFSLFFNAGVAFVFLGIICILFFFTNYIRASDVGRWYFIAPVSVFFNGISAVFMIWANKMKLYKELARNRVLQAILTLIIQLTLGLMIKNETGLLLGLLAGQTLSAFLLLRLFIGAKPFSVGPPVKKTFKQIASRYYGLLVYNTPTTFINTFINQAPVFLLQRYGGVSYVGSYNFAQRLLGLPQQFLSSAITEIFKEKASSHFNEQGNCRAIFLKTSKTLFLTAIVPFTIFFFLGSSIFEIVFGNQWRDAGLFASYLSIMFFLRFIVSPLTYIYIIVNKLKEHFLLHLLFLILIYVGFAFGDRYFEDKRYLVLVYSLIYSAIYILYYIRSYMFSKVSQFRA